MFHTTPSTEKKGSCIVLQRSAPFFSNHSWIVRYMEIITDDVGNICLEHPRTSAACKVFQRRKSIPVHVHQVITADRERKRLDWLVGSELAVVVLTILRHRSTQSQGAIIIWAVTLVQASIWLKPDIERWAAWIFLVFVSSILFHTSRTGSVGSETVLQSFVTLPILIVNLSTEPSHLSED